MATVVPWASDVGPLAPERLMPVADRSAGIIGRGEHLGHRAVGRHDVGEGASGVGTDPHGADRTRVRDHRGMARPWSRKREEQTSRQGHPARNRWSRCTSTTTTTRGGPRPRSTRPGSRRKRTDPEQERDILAEHFGEDWRTNFLYTGPSEEQLEEERRREQQALDDQDP